jgi:uncharacterized membrane protein YphA (DoxX/SURF4 family)
MSRERVALLAVRIALGVFFIFEGWDKLPWMLNPGLLTAALHKWAETGVPASKWYIETILVPGVPLFARLVFLGEIATGLALLSGVWLRPAAVIAFLMVLNIHFAHSSIFQYGFLSKGDGLPILGGLLALAFAGGSSSSNRPSGPRKPN